MERVMGWVGGWDDMFVCEEGIVETLDFINLLLVLEILDGCGRTWCVAREKGGAGGAAAAECQVFTNWATSASLPGIASGLSRIQ